MNLKIVAILNQPKIAYVYYIYTDSRNRDYVRKKIRKVINDSFPEFTILVGVITVFTKVNTDNHDHLFDLFYL